MTLHACFVILYVYPGHVESSRLSLLSLASLLHGLQHQVSNLGGRVGNDGTGSFERLDLVARRSLSARNDGSGMSHPSAGGCRSTSNESDDGLVVVVVGGNVLGGIFLHGASDLTDQDDTLSLGIREEDLDDVNVLGAGERVSSDSDREGLSEADVGGLAKGGHVSGCTNQMRV